MNPTSVQFGARIAKPVPEMPATFAHSRKVTTLASLLHELAMISPKNFPMLRTTASHLAACFGKAPTELTIDLINDNRDSFRPYLEARGHTETAVKSYVNFARLLLRHATELGWEPDSAVPDAWRTVLSQAEQAGCLEIAKHFAQSRKSPAAVSTDNVDYWVDQRVKDGAALQTTQLMKSKFWRLLLACGCIQQLPKSVLRQEQYSIPFDELYEDFRREVEGVLSWKQAAFAPDRPKGAKHRPVSASQLRSGICQLVGFAQKHLGVSEIRSFSQLCQKQTISEYALWCMNVRDVKGDTVQSYLRRLFAVLRQHPDYRSLDLTWCKPLLDSIPVEQECDRRMRKAKKYLEFAVIETIPDKIHMERSKLAKKSPKQLAFLVMSELFVRVLNLLVWRQKNMRECRIGGENPNLFKAKLPSYVPIDKPDWVLEEEQKNPDAEFWQFHFTPAETKMKNDVYAVLPRPLIGPLEEYLREYRPLIVDGSDPGTLFLTHTGTPLARQTVTLLVSELTLRYGGRRVTPHIFRDIVAFAWLKAHPKDYLTLSKILWHANVNTTIRIYGSRFNESSGSVAMESWVEQRSARTRSDR